MLDSWKKNELVNPGFNYGTEDDYHLKFFPPGELEIIRNAQNFGKFNVGFCELITKYS